MSWNDILSFACDIAGGAGNILMKGFRSADVNISYKSRTNLVTNMDMESEAYLCNKILQSFPSHAVVAEEGGGREGSEDIIWYVDPLDGTNNYAHGLAPFSVSIGVYSKSEGRVIAGVVFDPYHNELFCAERGGGAFLNGSPIRVSGTDSIGLAMLATGFPYDKHISPDNNLKQFCSLVPNIQGIRRMGSAAIDLCFVACGRLDGFWEPKLHPWDTAAGSLIVEEAGGRVTDYGGGEFYPEALEILATNGKLHRHLSNALSRL